MSKSNPNPAGNDLQPGDRAIVTDRNWGGLPLGKIVVIVNALDVDDCYQVREVGDTELYYCFPRRLGVAGSDPQNKLKRRRK